MYQDFGYTLLHAQAECTRPSFQAWGRGFISYVAREIADLLSCLRGQHISLYQSTGTVEPRKQCHGPPRVLSEFEQIFLLQSLVDKPTMYLELQSQVYELTGTWVHVSTMSYCTTPWID